MEKSRIGDNTIPTAVQRTPAEVWRMALLIAVESPLRPRSGDDVIDGKIVFSTCCHSYERFKRTEALRTQLRLVCQEWNAILKNVGHHLAFIDHGYLERVQFRGEEYRKIHRIEASRKCRECEANHFPRSEAGEPHASVAPLEDTQWVCSLLVSNQCRTDTEYRFIMKVLDNAPQLRAVEMVDYCIPKKYFIDILNHHALTRVTHLSIEFLGVSYEGQLCFPAVQHLCFTVLSYYQENKSLPDWWFPSLESFHLYRDSWGHGRDPFEGMDQFIAVHGKKITSLLIEYTPMGSSSESRPYHYQKDFWKWFPNLRLLGPGIGALHSLMPHPADSKLTSLAIPGRYIWGLTGTKFPFDRYIDDLLVACKSLRVKRLVMTDSWEDMTTGPPYRTSETSCWSSQLFDAAEVNGIRVFDSDRIPLHDQKGMRFIQRLRDATFSGHVLDSDSEEVI